MPLLAQFEIPRYPPYNCHPTYATMRAKFGMDLAFHLSATGLRSHCCGWRMRAPGQLKRWLDGL